MVLHVLGRNQGLLGAEGAVGGDFKCSAQKSSHWSEIFGPGLRGGKGMRISREKMIPGCRPR